jgi:hypothetical protein
MLHNLRLVQGLKAGTLSRLHVDEVMVVTLLEYIVFLTSTFNCYISENAESLRRAYSTKIDTLHKFRSKFISI